jgi:uncharacterized protein YqeY
MKEKLNADLKEAMKNKNVVLRDVIRLITTALKNAEIEKMAPLTEQEEQAVLQKMAKQRRDSISAYQTGGRDDLVQAEQEELKVIESYLPQQMSEDEVRAVVQTTIANSGVTDIKDIGKVMGPLMGQLRGKADGTMVQRIAREELSRQP